MAQPSKKPAFSLHTDPLQACGPPTKSKAYTPPAPTDSADSTPLFPSPPDYDSQASSGNEDSAIRGKSPGILSGHPNLVSRATWGRRAGPSSAECDAEVYDTESLNSLSKLEEVESLIKEPHPPERVHTNMFGILASAATFDDISLAGFRGHRDTLAMLTLPRVGHSKDLPIDAFFRIVSYVGFQEYKALRLSCRRWSAAVTYVRPLHLSVVCRLPTEILREIYSYLSPYDFNAARHTCRTWMICSLDYRLLATHLKRGGWWTAAQADTVINEELGHPIGGEWRLSKRLATECSLKPRWTGNGFTEFAEVPSIFQINKFNCPQVVQQRSGTSLLLTSEIDFSPLRAGIHRDFLGKRIKLKFIVSHCTRFLLVVDSHVVFIYSIQHVLSPFKNHVHGGYIEFLVSLAFPLLVLGADMDSSSGRYSLAILMENRVGMICEVPGLDNESRFGSPHSEHETRNVTASWDLKPSPTATPTTSQRPVPWPVYTDIFHTSPDSRSPATGLPSPIPIQFIQHTLWRNLCSESSPPINVSICPFRRCVAFGSRERPRPHIGPGVELHWIDTGTMTELNRWSELNGPAELVHFLPPRPGEEMVKFLRMVCSRTVSDIDFYGESAKHIKLCNFLGGMPLSDGQHMLYVDPADDGYFCLGTGLHHRFGSVKPVEVAVLLGPEHDRLPSLYKAGEELRWGARIVAVYGEEIWLFCVPPDLLQPQDTEGGNNDNTSFEFETFPDWPSPLIRGVEIGSIAGGATDLAVDASNGDITVYAFSDAGKAKVWQIGRHWKRRVWKRVARGSGELVEAETEEGGSFMRELAFPAKVSAAGRDVFGGGFAAPSPDDQGEDAQDLEDGAEEEESEASDEGYLSADEMEMIGGSCEWSDFGEDRWAQLTMTPLELQILCGG
ncbi:MAG: hypothetical protein LQ351_006215 [Letrouitia transgressa]|nr:MAG: hypothetical protein LQ351_006215 [Letrouitia transgressa]